MKIAQLLESFDKVKVGDHYVTDKALYGRDLGTDGDIGHNIFYFMPGCELEVVDIPDGWPLVTVKLIYCPDEFGPEVGENYSVAPLKLIKCFKGTMAEYNRKFLDDLHEATPTTKK
jgi:hypothetical protein